MTTSNVQSFKALLEPDQTRLRWVIARVPFDPAKAWPVRRGLRVRGEISSAKSIGEGFAFRTSLFPDPRGKGYILLINKKMQAGAGAAVGSLVRIRLEPDLEERAVVIPPELTRALRGDRRLPKWFAGLSDSMRREPRETRRDDGRAAAVDSGGRDGAAADFASRLPAPASGARGLGGDDASAAARPSARHLLLSDC